MMHKSLVWIRMRDRGDGTEGTLRKMFFSCQQLAARVVILFSIYSCIIWPPQHFHTNCTSLTHFLHIKHGRDRRDMVRCGHQLWYLSTYVAWELFVVGWQIIHQIKENNVHFLTEWVSNIKSQNNNDFFSREIRSPEL